MIAANACDNVASACSIAASADNIVDAKECKNKNVK